MVSRGYKCGMFDQLRCCVRMSREVNYFDANVSDRYCGQAELSSVLFVNTSGLASAVLHA